MFKVGDTVFLCLNKNSNLKTLILDKKRENKKNFYRIDWSLFKFNGVLNQVWISEKAIRADLQ